MSNTPKGAMTACRARNLAAIRAGECPVIAPNQIRWFRAHGHLTVIEKVGRKWTLRLADGAIGTAMSVNAVDGVLSRSDPEITARASRAKGRRA